MLRALLYAYVLGGLTFIPLVIGVVIFITIYTSVPVGDADVTKRTRKRLEASAAAEEEPIEEEAKYSTTETNDIPRTRKGWLTMRRTFEESAGDGGYVTLVRSFLDSRSKDPKRSRPKDMWYVVLKGKVLYLYEDEEMTECEAAVELSSHQVIIYPEALPDGELFAKRNAICLRPRSDASDKMPSVTKKMQLDREDVEVKMEGQSLARKEESEKDKDAARDEALDTFSPWFIFVRSNIEMEDWYFSLIHASEHPAQAPTLAPLSAIFDPAHMDQLISTLDEQPDVIPMRWLNALLGRFFLSHYRTHNLEAFIIGRLMKKLSKVKRPAFLTEIAVTQVSVGNKAPMLSKPMLKELTKEGDASIEVHMKYKGEIRITVEATAVINLGARFKSYTVKLELAAVLKELEGNLLIKVKRPPSNRIWYAFTQPPRIVLEVEPIVSDRQITWGMILSTIESKFKEILQESIVMPNMDDIAFFETGTYEHRGGIFSDTRRKPPTSSPPTPHISDDAQSTASAPLPDVNVTLSSDPKLATSEEPPIAPMTRAATDIPPSAVATAVDEFAETPRHVKRRSWFNSTKSDEATSSPPRSSSNSLFTSEPEETRGRTLEPESTSSSRSQSTPKPASLRPHTPEPSLNPESEASQSKTSLHSRRSSSSHTSVKDGKETHTDTPKIVVQSTSFSNPSTPRKSLDSQPARPSSPPSFFSTIKAKAAAADKQAISNTAKEAMRKWGVNWGGFKKDASASDDSSQTGASPPRSLLQAEGNAFLTKARTSYAEVRAAVAERKERDKTPHHDDGSDSSRPTSPAATRSRVVSTSKPVMPNGSVYSETPNNPSVVTSASRLGAPRLTPKKSIPSLGRVNTETDAQELSPVEVPVKHAPIHVQPVAKTMSIPGIHASHRGEVQSMGHVAQPPSPPPAVAAGPPSSSSSGPSEAMLKNPAIQTVYRLWKNPVTGHFDNEATSRPTTAENDEALSTNGNAAPLSVSEASPASTVLDTTERESESSTKADSTASAPPGPEALSPATQILAKPTPPPLPPRASVVVVNPTPLSQSLASTPGDTGSTVPSASETLKAVAMRDMEITERVGQPEDGDVEAEKLDYLQNVEDSTPRGPQMTMMTPTTPGPPPALPPRRPQASV